MTYSIDYRKQVLSSIDNGLTVREAAAFYKLSTSTIHSWRHILEPKKGRDKPQLKYLMTRCFMMSKRILMTINMSAQIVWAVVKPAFIMP